MKICITTRVESPIQKVWEQFGEKLFTSLNPPFPPVKLLRFDGSLKGDEVHLELNFIFFKQVWKSLIIEQKESEKEIYFIDQGIQLPFFLKKWKHHHRIVETDDGSAIIDDISYHTPTLLTDWLMLPVMYLQFLYRKPVYKKFFAIKNQTVITH